MSSKKKKNEKGKESNKQIIYNHKEKLQKHTKTETKIINVFINMVRRMTVVFIIVVQYSMIYARVCRMTIDQDRIWASPERKPVMLQPTRLLSSSLKPSSKVTSLELREFARSMTQAE